VDVEVVLDGEQQLGDRQRVEVVVGERGVGVDGGRVDVELFVDQLLEMVDGVHGSTRVAAVLRPVARKSGVARRGVARQPATKSATLRATCWRSLSAVIMW
jgi:hypothetical protein